MSYRGDIRLGDTLDFKFTTRAFSTGAPTTLAGSPAVAVYVDNGTTEITAGVTLTTDFDSRTGLNHVRIAATAGNGYADRTNCQVVITAGTVGGTNVVGEVIGEFSIGERINAEDAKLPVEGVVGSGSTTTSVVTSSLVPAAAVTDQFKGRVIIFKQDTATANLRGQATDITGSSSGGVLTVTALTTAPSSGDTFRMV